MGVPTSCAQQWGKGKTSEKIPGDIGYDYRKKFAMDSSMVDPRPAHLRTTSRAEFNRFLLAMRTNSPGTYWDSIPIKDDDDEIDNSQAKNAT